MTVGIAAICESGFCILMASDSLATYTPKRIKPNQEVGKQFQLPCGFTASIAGHFNHCEGVVAGLTTEMESLEHNPIIYLDHIRAAMCRAQAGELQYRFSNKLLNELGMTLEQWQKESTTNPRLRKTGRAIIKLTPIVVELIVGGFSGGHPILLSVVDKNPVEIVTGHETIGSGGEYALSHLNSRNQNTFMSFQRSVLHIAEALDAAKLDPHVGEPSDWVVLQANGTIFRLPANHEVIQDLKKQYSGDSAGLDEDDGARERLRKILYRPEDINPRLPFVLDVRVKDLWRYEGGAFLGKSEPAGAKCLGPLPFGLK